ncbi:MAG: hypothetical protein IPJ08_20330 [Burkholderiales bacterium]|nr:hypothetical protein [Burkholderiales bacterium]
MKPTPMNRLAALDKRALRIALPFAVLLVLLECWLLVLRAPVQQWRALRAERATLDSGAQPLRAADLAGQREALRRLQAELGAPATGLAEPDASLMPLMASLDRLATRHAVLLGTVRPAGRVPQAGVLQTDHEVSARGAYPALAAWLAAASTELAPLTLGELSLRALDGNAQVELTLRVSDFRPIAATAASGPAP